MVRVSILCAVAFSVGIVIYVVVL